MKKELTLCSVIILCLLQITPIIFQESGATLLEIDFMRSNQPSVSLNSTSQYSMMYSSTLQSQQTHLENDTIIIGENISFNGTFLREDIAISEITIHAGIYRTRNGTLKVPDASYDTFGGSLDLSQYSWEFFEGIKKSTLVNITVNFTNQDTDVFVFWADSDNTTWSYGNNLVGPEMATEAIPETAILDADRDGTLAIGMFDYSLESGNYSVVLNSTETRSANESGNSVMLQAYFSGRNITVDVMLSGILENETVLEIRFLNISLRTNFSPHIFNLEVQSQNHEHTVTWEISDLNQNDTHTHDILLSGDNGVTYQYIAFRVEETYFVWDSLGFLEREYMLKVRVEDSHGLTDEAEVVVNYEIRPSTTTLTIESPGNLVFNSPSPDNFIHWDIITQNRWDYRINQNESLVASGNGQGSGSIVYSLDNLQSGVYVFELYVTVSDQIFEDQIMVTVLPSQLNQVFLGISYGITIGSLVIIVAGLYKLASFRMRREDGGGLMIIGP